MKINKQSFLKTVEMLVALVFGLVYWLYDLHIATAALMVSMTVFIILVKVLGEQLSKLQLFSWLAVMILGGTAVFLRDENIIKWKPTVIYSVLSVVFALSHFIGQQTLVERLIGDKIKAPAFMLRKVNLSSTFFFLFLSMLNVFVILNFSTTAWVNFKIFGIFIIDAIYLAGCLYYLRAYLQDL